MFHFPTFPPHTLCVQMRVTGHDSSWVSPFGHPRITARLPTPQGLSQATTSFIGSRCQGIHHVPFIACHTKTKHNKQLQRCSRPLYKSQTTNPDTPHPHASHERSRQAQAPRHQTPKAPPSNSSPPTPTRDQPPHVTRWSNMGLIPQNPNSVPNPHPSPTHSERQAGSVDIPLVSNPGQHPHGCCETGDNHHPHTTSAQERCCSIAP